MQGIPGTTRQNIWFIYDGAQHILRLRYINTSKLHISGGALDVANLMLAVTFPDASHFFWSHLKSIFYQACVDTLEDLAAWIVGTSVDIANAPDYVCMHLTIIHQSPSTVQSPSWQQLRIIPIASSCITTSIKVPSCQIL